KVARGVGGGLEQAGVGFGQVVFVGEVHLVDKIEEPQRRQEPAVDGARGGAGVADHHHPVSNGVCVAHRLQGVGKQLHLVVQGRGGVDGGHLLRQLLGVHAQEGEQVGDLLAGSELATV